MNTFRCARCNQPIRNFGRRRIVVDGVPSWLGPCCSQAVARIRVDEGDFRAFEGRTPCAPVAPTRQCSICDRHAPSLARQDSYARTAVVIDATAVTPKGERCPMFAVAECV